MKTIKQIADELGVSKQAVHQKRKSKELSTALQPFTSTVDGIVYISVDGVNLIKSAFKSKERQTVDDNKSATEKENNTEILKVLQSTISTLQTQLCVKDKQIEELTATVKSQAQSINADRHSELAGKLQEQALLINGEEKATRIHRLKQFFKGE